MRYFLFIFLFLISISHAASVAQEIYPFTSNIDKNRFAVLTQEVRCLVCQNQNIAESNAPLASDLRQKIYMMINENKSNADIKNYLVKRYGNYILFNPPFNHETLLLWIFPGLTFSILLFLLRKLLF
ncbi:MAG: hypothetical protein A3F12_01430 [Gammaproteobacteria bacterium RIFCSPHIGHO2_12_FULL_38_14]|nr:MAG: hypothetical protein A3F12_01430 [Gammaproteobacteria bacterium RIFCSPHIGHO2_12_FULL_38_14]